MGHDDDHQFGRILSRRQVLLLLGAGGAAVLPACSTGARPSGRTTGTTAPREGSTILGQGPATAVAPEVPAPACVVRPAQTEGPYFVDEKLNRSFIRSDPSDGSVREGIPLRLTINVSRVSAGTCAAFSGAVVDIWHCDADGVYSDVRDPGFNTAGKKFLRGYQVTGADGRATFVTVYPGWYQGRAVHIHFKIRNDPGASRGFDFTSQLYFDERVTDQVQTQPPYSARSRGRVRNTADALYRNGGDQLLLSPTREDEGYVATFDIGVQPV